MSTDSKQKSVEEENNNPVEPPYILVGKCPGCSRAASEEEKKIFIACMTIVEVMTKVTNQERQDILNFVIQKSDLHEKWIGHIAPNGVSFQSLGVVLPEDHHAFVQGRYNGYHYVFINQQAGPKRIYTLAAQPA